ncbi:hypothetical protein DFH07DRAFT_776851 [Mycena maculata]|uniref:Uncharacterized protein n=1 Tax=Mycena maculata TaxID=230809 RepID=A0AAD7IML6_9AGAR|nr:hypothetical protein DFH07DRAFT_776851 [Mycena maculata]
MHPRKLIESRAGHKLFELFDCGATCPVTCLATAWQVPLRHVTPASLVAPSVKLLNTVHFSPKTETIAKFWGFTLPNCLRLYSILRLLEVETITHFCVCNCTVPVPIWSAGKKRLKFSHRSSDEQFKFPQKWRLFGLPFLKNINPGKQAYALRTASTYSQMRKEGEKSFLMLEVLGRVQGLVSLAQHIKSEQQDGMIDWDAVVAENN